MGSGMVHVTRKMPGLETCAIADIAPERARQVLRGVGIAETHLVTTNQRGVAEDALRAGKYVLTEDALLLSELETLDAVVEATGVTEIGAQVAWNCVTRGKHVVMLNVETDVTVGVILDRLARKGGSVYTVAAGDEPAVCKMLYDFSRTMGFEVVTLGKGKNNPINHAIKPDMVVEEAASKGMNPKMLASFIDGTKTMVEMAAVSNATGLVPDVPGMRGPKVELDDLLKVFIPTADGGILSKRGCVEYSTGSIAPGVFAIVTTDEPRIAADMRFVSMGEGPYYLFFRPYHLCNIETPLAVAEAVVYGEATVTAQTMHAEVVPIAKRDLAPGEIIGGIGSADVFHRIYDYRASRAIQGVPMGIATGATVVQPIKQGQPLTAAHVALDQSTFVYKLRQMQDAMLDLEEERRV